MSSETNFKQEHELQNLIKSSSSKETKISTTGILLLSISGGAALALSAICLPFVTPALRRICLPYVPATEQQIENVVKALKAGNGWREMNSSKRLLVDLGSGDGRIVERTSIEGIKSFGVELNLWLVIYSRIHALWAGIKPKPSYKKVDLWTYSLREYTDVIIFGVGPMMKDLERKFDGELQEGTRVVACRFKLPNWQPIAIIGSGVDTVWLYKVTKSSLEHK